MSEFTPSKTYRTRSGKVARAWQDNPRGQSAMPGGSSSMAVVAAADPEQSNRAQYGGGSTQTDQYSMRRGGLVLNTVKLNKYGWIHTKGEENIRGVSRHSWPHTFHNDFLPHDCFKELNKTCWNNESAIGGVMIKFWESHLDGQEHKMPRMGQPDPVYDISNYYGFNGKAVMNLNTLNFPMKVQPSRNKATKVDADSVNTQGDRIPGLPLHAGNPAVLGTSTGTSTEYFTQGTFVNQVLQIPSIQPTTSLKVLAFQRLSSSLHHVSMWRRFPVI